MDIESSLGTCLILEEGQIVLPSALPSTIKDVKALFVFCNNLWQLHRYDVLALCNIFLIKKWHRIILVLGHDYTRMFTFRSKVKPYTFEENLALVSGNFLLKTKSSSVGSYSFSKKTWRDSTDGD